MSTELVASRGIRAHERSGTIELVESEELTPDSSGTIRIYPFFPQIWQRIRVGAEVEMTEGPTATVGHATITRVVPAAAPVQ